MSVTPWEQKGCTVCRQQWMSGNPPPQFAVSIPRHGMLHHCAACGTWWEQLERYATEIPDEEARGAYGDLERLLAGADILITDIAGNTATARADTGAAAQTLLRLGYTAEAGRYTRPIADEADRITLMQSLIDQKARFMGGTGWAPAEVALYFRDLGKLHGPITEITWRNPHTTRVEVH